MSTRYLTKPLKANKNINDLHSFIEKYNFGTLLVINNNEIEASHVPVMLDRGKGKFGLLYWHLAKQNAQTILLNGKNTALFIFQGPHSYISPSWYKTSPNVPTWNYTVVHIQGVPKKISQSQLSDDLDKFVKHHESISNANKEYLIPENYKAKLMEHIDGFHMEITKLEGKFKLGQNRSQEDQQNMLNELLNQPNDSTALDLAKFILNQDN